MSKHDPSEPQKFPIEIGGKTRHLSYPLPSLFAFEDKTGIDLLSGVKEGQFGAGSKLAKNKLALVWAGLIANEPELTFEQVASWVHLGNFNYVQETAFEALFKTMPERREADGGGPLAESPDSEQTASKSGQSVDTDSNLVTKSSVN